MSKRRRYHLSQYTVVCEEYRHSLSGMQNVININIAMSIGVITIIVALLSVGEKAQFQPFALVLPAMGLLSSVACIRTMLYGKKEIENYQRILCCFEKKLRLRRIHEIKPYKPIHITLIAFVVNALVFCAILVFELANYCDFHEFIQKYNDVLWAFIVIAGIGKMLLFISNKTYRIEQKRRKR